MDLSMSSVWTFPVFVGSGKRLFGQDTAPNGLILMKTEPCPSGAVMNIYRRIARDAQG